MSFRDANKSISVMVVCLAAIVLIQPVTAQERDGDGGSGSNLITSVPRTMSYQGILKDSGGDPVTDSVYSVTFRIFNIASGGTSLWDETLPCTTSAGLFNALFSNVNLPFDEDYWLELEVDSEILDPRQKMNMVGYAAVSDTADYAFASAAAGNGWVDDGTIVMLETNSDSVGIGTATPTEKLEVAGNIIVSGKATIGPNHTNSGYCGFVAGDHNTATGDHSVVSGGHYNEAKERFSAVGGGYQNVAHDTGSTVGGGQYNDAWEMFCTVAGGIANGAHGKRSTVGGGSQNHAIGERSVVAGGESNQAVGDSSAVAGGAHNNAGGDYSTVGGGLANLAYGYISTISGGIDNETGGDRSSIGGGTGNSASGSYTTIGGGYSNSTSSSYSTVGGGYLNSASSNYSTIGGGGNNIANNICAIVAGGCHNSATNYASTVAGGHTNTASGYASVVVGGEQNLSSASHSVVLGGLNDTISSGALYSMAFGRDVKVNNNYRIIFFEGNYDGCFGINRDRDDGALVGPFQVGTNSNNGNGAYLSGGGTWTTGSSREFKENFQSLDSNELMTKISSLEITSWNYKDSDEKHIGPVAEDFVAAFDVGIIRESDGQRDNQYLAASDVAGVALAGIKELIQQNRELRDLIIQMENRITELEKR